ncbi:hypothetical protein GCM10023159_25770 [Brevibacterium yomogidense]
MKRQADRSSLSFYDANARGIVPSLAESGCELRHLPLSKHQVSKTQAETCLILIKN